MLTGFLGAGKTTFLQNLLEEYKDKRIGVIVNEFGSVNIDARLVEHSGIRMAELQNGSIFCACIKDKFVESLIAMSGTEIDYLFIEASGLADPSSMPSILSGIREVLQRDLEYRHSVCIVDAASFQELSEVLVALKRQVAFSDIILINKADLVSEKEINEIILQINEINDHAVIACASYCKTDIRGLLERPSGLSMEGEESTNTVSGRPHSIVLKQRKTIEEESLLSFLQDIAPSTYRIKGFAETENGPREISCVGTQIAVSPWKSKISDGRIVVISSVGIRIVSILCAAMEKYMKGSVTM